MAEMGRFIYAGTMGGLQRSGDGGKTWERSKEGLETNWVGLLAAGQGEVYAGYWQGLYRSLDSGASWSPMAPPDSTEDMKSIAVIDSFLYIGTRGSLYRSSDRGKTWTRIALTGAMDILTLHASQGVLWAGDSEGQVYRSNDTGRTWKDITGTGFEPSDWEFSAVAVNGNLVYGGGIGGAIRFPANSTVEEPPQFNFGLGRQRVTAVGSSGIRIYAGYSGRGYYGKDHGKYWYRQLAGDGYGYSTPSAYLRFSSSIWSASDAIGWTGGIYGFSNGMDNPRDWEADSGLGETKVYALARIGGSMFAGSEKGVYRSMDTAKSWLSAFRGMDSTPAQVLIAGGAALFAGSHAKGLFRSTDQGESWSPVGSGLKNPVMALAYAGGVLVAAADSGRRRFAYHLLGRRRHLPGGRHGQGHGMAAARFRPAPPGGGWWRSGKRPGDPTLFRPDPGDHGLRDRSARSEAAGYDRPRPPPAEIPLTPPSLSARGKA